MLLVLGFAVALLAVAVIEVGPLVLVFLAPVSVFVAVFAFFSVRPHWTETRVTLTRDRLVLKTLFCGSEKVKEYNLHKTSRAKKHWVKGARGSGRHATGFEGIDVTSKRGTAHFGNGLKAEGGTRTTASERELDWIEWRLNRFLGHATDAESPDGADDGRPGR